ncbi:MAG: hypothetical protein M1514_03320 [Patescibacteria group bacterium]|nr:hypothetical protein [Patescibacteria group bacterium]
MANQSQILEKGEIYFIYSPKVQEEKVTGFSDVERFFLVMHPKDQNLFRLIIIGHKKLPPITEKGEAYWGFVDKIGRKAEEIEDEFDPESHLTKTQGERFRGPGRPAGEGVYALARHTDHDHLIYSLELPEKLGPVQKDLNIEKSASYILSVKNPSQSTPKGVGLEESAEARYPKDLQSEFGSRRFISKDLGQFLNYEGTQILFVSAAQNYYKELDIRLEPEKETLETAEIFSDLKMEKVIHPLETLVKGKWE